MPLGEVTIGCAANPEADLAGYRIYCGQSALVLSFLQEFPVASLPNPSAPAMRCTTFPFYGTLFFAVTAYDTSNNESGLSAVVSKAVAPRLYPLSWP